MHNSSTYLCTTRRSIDNFNSHAELFYTYMFVLMCMNFYVFAFKGREMICGT